MSVTDAYLNAAAMAAALLRRSEVTAAWEQPSALPKMTVGALAGHLGYQIFSVAPTLDAPVSEQPPISLLEHYARATWIEAPLDDAANAGIRDRGANIGAQGPAELSKRAEAAVSELRTRFADLDDSQPVFLPEKDWALSLGDFLTTRLLELAVHMDDLAVSVGQAAPELPDSAFDPVLVLLARLAARRHGQVALLRALSRVERAQGAINAI
ncbi:MAG: maleylpyruvate isomerase N-terminal domain-containing protein [Micromonosporaceae bacterium]